MGEAAINEQESKMVKLISNQVTTRQTALQNQYDSVVKALDAECTRVKALEASQADAQYRQQVQALEMQRDQQKNALDQLAQQEKFALGQRAAQMQQQRAQMELAQQMQKAMYGQK